MNEAEIRWYDYPRLLWWLLLDRLHEQRERPIYISMERVNNELRKIASMERMDVHDECMERVKRRMTLGSKCPDPPMFKKKEDGKATSTPRSRGTDVAPV